MLFLFINIGIKIFVSVTLKKIKIIFVPIDDLQCFRFCRKFGACALRGRPDQNKHCRCRYSFVSTAQRKCQTFAVPMVVAIKEQGIAS